MREIILLVTYKVKSGLTDNFLNEIRDSGILGEISQESGFLRYDYYKSTNKADEIVLIEKWQSEFHQQKHLGLSHMEKLKAIKEKYVTQTIIEKLYSE